MQYEAIGVCIAKTFNRLLDDRLLGPVYMISLSLDEMRIYPYKGSNVLLNHEA